MLEYHVDVTYNISVGHAMRLPCDDVENGESRNVMWRRKGGVPLDTDAGVEVRGNAIWFLPAQAKHSGVYECKYATHTHTHTTTHKRVFKKHKHYEEMLITSWSLDSPCGGPKGFHLNR